MIHLPIQFKHKGFLLLGGVAVITIGAVIFTIYHYSTNNKGAVIPSSTSPTNSSTNSSGSQTNKLSSLGNGSGSSISNNTSSTNSGNTLAPDAPWGNFISNHTPGTNSSPTQEQSICNTTPGASCYIKFTNAQGGEVKVLSTQVTDSSGNTNWTWDVKQAGFSSGTWKVAAIATLNGQTKTTQDTRDLVIQ